MFIDDNQSIFLQKIITNFFDGKEYTKEIHNNSFCLKNNSSIAILDFYQSGIVYNLNIKNDIINNDYDFDRYGLLEKEQYRHWNFSKKDWICCRQSDGLRKREYFSGKLIGESFSNENNQFHNLKGHAILQYGNRTYMINGKYVDENIDFESQEQMEEYLKNWEILNND